MTQKNKMMTIKGPVQYRLMRKMDGRLVLQGLMVYHKTLKAEIAALKERIRELEGALVDIDGVIKAVNLDMGGKHTYALSGSPDRIRQAVGKMKQVLAEQALKEKEK